MRSTCVVGSVWSGGRIQWENEEGEEGEGGNLKEKDTSGLPD